MDFEDIDNLDIPDEEKEEMKRMLQEALDHYIDGMQGYEDDEGEDEDTDLPGSNLKGRVYMFNLGGENREEILKHIREAAKQYNEMTGVKTIHNILITPMTHLPIYFDETVYFKFTMDPNDIIGFDEFYRVMTESFITKFILASYYGINDCNPANSTAKIYTDDGIYGILEIQNPFNTVVEEDDENPIYPEEAVLVANNSMAYPNGSALSKSPHYMKTSVYIQPGYGYIEGRWELHAMEGVLPDVDNDVFAKHITKDFLRFIDDHYMNIAHEIGNGDKIKDAVTARLGAIEFSPIINYIQSKSSTIVVVRQNPIGIYGHRIFELSPSEVILSVDPYRDDAPTLAEIEPYLPSIVSWYYSSPYLTYIFKDVFFEAGMHSYLGQLAREYHLDYRLIRTGRQFIHKDLDPKLEIPKSMSITGHIRGCEMVIVDRDDWVKIIANGGNRYIIGLMKFQTGIYSSYEQEHFAFTNWARKMKLDKILDIGPSWICGSDSANHTYMIAAHTNCTELQYKRVETKILKPGSFLDHLINPGTNKD